MHPQKHEVLDRVGAATRPKLHAVAVAFKVTVDEIVRAGLHRADVSPQAVSAAMRFEQQNPGVLGKLREWPEQCRFCLDVVAEPAVCAFCSAFGCTECISGKGCPTCIEAARRDRERARIEEVTREQRAAASASAA